MSTQTRHVGPRVPEDTLALRLVIARVFAGHHNVASAALAAGVSRQNWSNWERGKPMQHTDALIAQIARAMGVDEDWLRYGGPLNGPGTQNTPRPDGPGGEEVRRQGLEPRTQWFARARRRPGSGPTVLPLMDPTRGDLEEAA